MTTGRRWHEATGLRVGRGDDVVRPAHPGLDTEKAFQKRQAQADLERHGPDFAPIEGVFSKLESFLRHRAARTPKALERAISTGLATVTAKDARGFFKHCGFPLIPQPP